MSHRTVPFEDQGYVYDPTAQQAPPAAKACRARGGIRAAAQRPLVAHAISGERAAFSQLETALLLLVRSVDAARDRRALLFRPDR